MSALEPGKVYMATVRGISSVVFNTDDWGTIKGSTVPSSSVTDARPLIVLDLLTDDRWRPSRLVRDLRRMDWGLLADQIEAQTKPARIPEPGLWGVVEASAEYTARTTWVCRKPGRWHCPEHGDATWSVLIDPTLVREGVAS